MAPAVADRLRPMEASGQVASATTVCAECGVTKKWEGVMLSGGPDLGEVSSTGECGHRLCHQEAINEAANTPSGRAVFAPVTAELRLSPLS